MTEPTFTDAEIETLAARATARSLLAAMAGAEAPPAPAVSRADLWAYANRTPGAPISFAVERALRSDAGALATYRRIMALRAVNVSERAAAAYAGGPFERKLNGALAQIIEEDGAPPSLLITLDPGLKTIPRFIEVVALEGVVRRALPEAIDGHIVMDLPRQDAELDLLRILLANPEAAVYLLP
jgi:hypothetical protein